MNNSTPTTWRTARLGDIADLHWGDTNTTKAAYRPSGYLAFSASGPDGFMDHYDFDREGVVLSAIGANCGETWYTSGKWSCIKNTICFWGLDGKADTRFLYYKTHNKNIWPQRGSAQPFISQADARDLELEIPASINDQKRIAAALSAFDDKIEVNNKISRTLEQMAQTIFKEWFVDFRFPGYEDAEFADSELGQIPKDWDVKRLFDVAEVTYGFPFKSDLFNEEKKGTPLVRIRNVADGKTETYTTEQADKKYLISDGDILVGMDGEFYVRRWAGGSAYLNQRVAKVIPKPGVSWWYLFSVLVPAVAQKQGEVGGTTVAHLTDRHLRDLRFVASPSDAFDFGRIDAIYQKQIQIALENKKLSALRDLLLPKLMSGEIHV